MKSCNAALPFEGLSFKSPGNFSNAHHIQRLLTLVLSFISLLSFAGRIHIKSSPVTGKHMDSYEIKAAASPLTGAESVRANLYLLNANNTTFLADGVLIEYNNLYHDSVYLEDAHKFTNMGENLGLLRYGEILAIERRPIISSTDTLFFKLWKTVIRNYQFEFVLVNMNHPGMEAFLEDAYLGTSLQLSLNGTTKLNFSVNTDSASSNADRFKIVYKTLLAPGAPLPVTFTSVKGIHLNSKVSIDWKVENEINIKGYEVERSVGYVDFVTINSISKKGLTSASGSYSMTDDNPPNGNVLYRIKSIDQDGTQRFSQTIKVSTGNVNSREIRVYPNPVTGNMINLQFTNQPLGIYQVRMINSKGQAVFSGKLTVMGSDVSQPIFSNCKLWRGIYLIEIKSPDNIFQIRKIIVKE